MAYSLAYTVANLFGGNVIKTNFIAVFGAKTLSGAGGYNPLDNSGNPIALATYNGVISGSITGYVPSISNGSLIFTGSVGAPNGAVLSCTTVSGLSITIAIQTESNSYSVSTIAQANTAYQQCVLADKIRFRAGGYNLTATRQLINRTTSPAGTWTGSAILEDGNWVVMTCDIGVVAKFGALEIASGGSANPRYLKVENLVFESPLQAGNTGLGVGESANVSAQLYFNGSSHAWVNNCLFKHNIQVTQTTPGAFRNISNGGGFTGNVLITNNTILDGRGGIFGAYRNSFIRNNVIRRVSADHLFINECDNLEIIGNYLTDKIYLATIQNVTNIQTGATTTVTVASAAAATVGENTAFDGFTGVYAVLNKTCQAVLSKTATTITVQLDTTGLPSGATTGQIIISDPVHGDFIQFANVGEQNNVKVRGNILTRGIDDGTYLPDGQGIFGGDAVPVRSNWLIEGNIYNGTLVRAISVGQLKDSIIRSNTVTRTLGIDAANGNAIPGIFVSGSNISSNQVLDNIASQYQIGAAISLNNYTLPLVDNDAFPADPADIATYQSVFQMPVTAPNTSYNAVKAFATRTDAGGAFTGYTIFPGATPYYNFDTNVYSNPRA